MLGVKLGAGLLRIGPGVWLTGGLNEGREGFPNAEFRVWEPGPMDGLEGIDGAGVGRLKEGLGWLKDGLGRLNDGLGWLKDGLGRLNDGLG